MSSLPRCSQTGLTKSCSKRQSAPPSGSRLRGLEDFDSLCLSLADGVFGNYCALDAFEVLGSVSKNECEDFLKAFMTPDRLAMSVISPVKA